MGAGHAHALYVHEHSPVHRLAPEVKVAAAFLFVLAVAVTPRDAVWAFAVDAVALATVTRTARIGPRFVVARLAVVIPFLLLAATVPFVAGGERTSLLGIQVSREGLWGAWNIVAKATLGAWTSVLLAGTTEVPRILRGLERLRVPRAFTMIATFMIRYLEVVTAEVGRIRTAMTARGYDPRWLSQARPIASSAGSLFIRSYERGERVHAAMLSRGFTGTMPDLDGGHAGRGQWIAAGLLPAVSVTTATLALVGVL